MLRGWCRLALTAYIDLKSPEFLTKEAKMSTPISIDDFNCGVMAQI
jgi:hypothetical protein